MWESIKYVSGTFTLMAFLAVCIVTILKININAKKNLINSAKSDKQAKLIDKTLEFFSVNTENLNSKQKYELVMIQINEKSKRHFRMTILIIILSLIFASVLIFSIYMSKNQQKVNRKNGFIIDCKLASYGEEKVKEITGIRNILDLKNENVFRYIEDKNKIITPYFKYFNQFFTRKFLEVPHLGYYDTLSFPDVHYPTFDIKMINNTSKTIVLDKITLDVISSQINKKPYIYFFTEASNEDNNNFNLSMINEGWEKWKSCNIKFNLNSKPSEKETFKSKNKSFNYKVSIPYFENNHKIDMSNYLIREGVDVPFLKERSRKKIYPYQDLNNFMKAFGKFNYVENDSYYYAFAEGEIELIDSKNHVNKMQFTSKILLNLPSLGGVLEIFDSYDLKLKNEGQNYKKFFSISRSLAPNESERFLLTLAAEKTSNHKFKIGLDNINKINLKTNEINLDIFLPRTSYEVFKDKDKYFLNMQ